MLNHRGSCRFSSRVFTIRQIQDRAQKFIKCGDWHRMLTLQINCNSRELREGSFEVFDNFLRDDLRGGKIGAVCEAFVFEPEPSRWENE